MSDMQRLVKLGIGVNRKTYFKLIYTIYTGIAKYNILHTAIFGMN